MPISLLQLRTAVLVFLRNLVTTKFSTAVRFSTRVQVAHSECNLELFFVSQFLLPEAAQHITIKMLMLKIQSGPWISATWRAKQHLHSGRPDFELLLREGTS